MTAKYALLQQIRNNEPIRRETHPDFVLHLHRALLLGLRERGTLNLLQYRRAEEQLYRRFRPRHGDSTQ